jgi:hypothetical protein
LAAEAYHLAAVLLIGVRAEDAAWNAALAACFDADADGGWEGQLGALLPPDPAGTTRY